MAAAGAAEEARAADAAGASRTARAALGFEQFLAGDLEAVKTAHRAVRPQAAHLDAPHDRRGDDRSRQSRRRSHCRPYRGDTGPVKGAEANIGVVRMLDKILLDLGVAHASEILEAPDPERAAAASLGDVYDTAFTRAIRNGAK